MQATVLQENNLRSKGSADIQCHHCGDDCKDGLIEVNDHSFCCNGCVMVFQLLEDNGLSYFYHEGTGVRPQEVDYAFLDDEQVVDALVHFKDDNLTKIVLELPTIHCVSCIWLLEHLTKLVSAVKQSRVDYLKKTCSVLFDHNQMNLRGIIEVLSSIGYPPRFNLDKIDKRHSVPQSGRSLYYKLGVAGFCFGNIMLLSFPEYLGLQGDRAFTYLSYFNILLALPVVFYAGADYLRSAWTSARRAELGIDLPIAIGMLVLFTRSIVEISMGLGEGYLDSLAGFVFFLLIGRWFQQRSFDSIHFDRDYKSYFPISVERKEADMWSYVNVRSLEIGDIIKLKHGEIIPCDGLLKGGEGRIDYSFVTGEEYQQIKNLGDKLYAGGRQQGSAIELIVTKAVDQSYLTKLWDEEVFAEQKADLPSKLMDMISKYFVAAILLLALGTFIYWMGRDMAMAVKTTTAVLIIACPCVLALSVPFIYGNMMRILARQQVYVRNTGVLEAIADVTHILFDKTGTLTDMNSMTVEFYGEELNEHELSMIAAIVHQSNHILCRRLTIHHKDGPSCKVEHFKEYIGQGLEGIVWNTKIRMGSAAFILGATDNQDKTEVLVEIDSRYKGRYTFKQSLRKGILDTICRLKTRFSLQLLSGDNSNDKQRMTELLGGEVPLYFGQTPLQKLNKVKDLQSQSCQVMMIGDGLNDAGALRQSNVGVVISHADNSFSPACDVILSHEPFSRLTDYISFIVGGRSLLYGAVGLSIIYNVVGLSLAMAGYLTPVVAAILMPISSVTVMVYGLISTEILFRWKFRQLAKV